jgi:hypothetical protein
MRVGFVRMNSDARPDVVVALGDRDDVAPFALPSGDVEEAATPRARAASSTCVLALLSARRN